MTDQCDIDPIRLGHAIADMARKQFGVGIGDRRIELIARWASTHAAFEDIAGAAREGWNGWLMARLLNFISDDHAEMLLDEMDREVAREREDAGK